MDGMRGNSGLEGRLVGHGVLGWRLRARAALGWLACVGALTGLMACSEPPQPPLVVGLNTWVGYDPLVLARDRGLADARQVKVVELISSAEALRHLRNGLLDAAGLTMDEALRLVDSGFDVRIVALLDTSAGADVVVAAPQVRLAQQAFEHQRAHGGVFHRDVFTAQLLQAGDAR